MADYERLLPHLEQVPLELGRAVYESGSEGVMGIALFMGRETTPSRAVVQSAVLNRMRRQARRRRFQCVLNPSMCGSAQIREEP